MRTFLILTIFTVICGQALHSHISFGSLSYDSYSSTEHAEDHMGEDCPACNVFSPKFQNHYPTLTKTYNVSSGFISYQIEPVFKESFISISIPPRAPPVV